MASDIKSVASDSSDSVKCLNDFIDIHDRPLKGCYYIPLKKPKNYRTLRSRIRLKDIPFIAERAKLYQIPESKLQETIKFLNSKDKTKFQTESSIVMCKDLSCLDLLRLTKKQQFNPYAPLRLIHEARNCIVHQDWRNLSRCLSILISMKNLKQFYGIVLRYCLISLLYDPIVRKYKPELLNRFLEGVTHCTTETEIHEFLQNIYQIEPTKTSSIIMDSFTLETDAEDNDTDSDSGTDDNELNINTKNEIEKNLNVDNLQNNIENVQTAAPHQADKIIVKKSKKWRWRTYPNLGKSLAPINYIKTVKVETSLNNKQPTNDGKNLELINSIKTEEEDTNLNKIILKKKNHTRNDAQNLQLQKLELINNSKPKEEAKKIKLKTKQSINDGKNLKIMNCIKTKKKDKNLKKNKNIINESKILQLKKLEIINNIETKEHAIKIKLKKKKHTINDGKEFQSKILN